MPMGKKARLKTGFSLIELLVVLAIAAILSAMAAPSFRGLIANTRIQSVTSDLQAGLLFARSEAVKRNAAVQIVADEDDWMKGWSVQDADNNVLLTGQVRDHITIKSNATTFSFLSSGRVSGANLPTFQIVDDLEVGDVRCLTADRGGRAYVVRQSC